MWSAVIKNIEYYKPVYRVEVDVQKDGAKIETEIIDIDDGLTISEAVERVKAVLRKYEHAESIGADLNKYIGKEIKL